VKMSWAANTGKPQPLEEMHRVALIGMSKRDLYNEIGTSIRSSAVQNRCS
jgi:hypothetical protein